MLKIWWVMNYLRFYSENFCLSKPMVGSIYPILYEVGIPNLVCGYLMGVRTVTQGVLFSDHLDLDLGPQLLKYLVFGGKM